MARSYKFGWSQWGQTTPAFIVRLRKLILYLTGGIGVFMPMITKWTGWQAQDIAQIGGLSVFILTGLADFFGVKVDTDTVPAKDVAAIETNN